MLFRTELKWFKEVQNIVSEHRRLVVINVQSNFYISLKKKQTRFSHNIILRSNELWLISTVI